MELKQTLISVVIFILIIGGTIFGTKFYTDKAWEKRIAESAIKPDTVTKVEYIHLPRVSGSAQSIKRPIQPTPKVAIENVDSLKIIINSLGEPKSCVISNDTLGKLLITYYPWRELEKATAWKWAWDPAPVREIIKEQKVYITIPASELTFWDKARPYLEGAAFGIVLISAVQLLGRTSK